MNSWAERIKLKMKELGLKQEELAQQLGITRGAVTHYLSGRRVPPLKQFHNLAAVLKTDPAWLQFGVTADNKKKSSDSQQRETISSQSNHHPIPILTSKQISKQPDVRRINKKSIEEWLANFYTDQPNWFAIRVQGDSMVSTTGQKSFYDGDIIIIDPTLNPKNGDYIVAVMPKNNDATFKQYIIDGGIKYLKPLNGQYPMIEVGSKYVYCGVVVRSLSEHR